MEQNYPNPFNPTSQIEYSLPKAGLVQINFYNILGELVKTLVNEYKDVGVFKLNFNAA